MFHVVMAEPVIPVKRGVGHRPSNAVFSAFRLTGTDAVQDKARNRRHHAAVRMWPAGTLAGVLVFAT